MGLIFKNLMLEITRKCNMNCKHCMRGEQQDITMSSDVIEKVIYSASEIDHLSLTGGEPSLNPEVIASLLYYIKESGVKIGAFYCATNAAKYSAEFITYLNELYSLCINKDKCILTISNDQYHSKADFNAVAEYKNLPYYNSEKDLGEISKANILNEGRAFENKLGNFNIPIEKNIYNYGIIGFDLYVGDRIYVNALGDVLLNADLSYKNQSNNRIGNILYEPIDCILRKRFYVLPDRYFEKNTKLIYCINIVAEEGTVFDHSLEDRRYFLYPGVAISNYKNFLNNIRITPVYTNELERQNDLSLIFKEMPIEDKRCNGMEIEYCIPNNDPKKLTIEILKYPISEASYVR